MATTVAERVFADTNVLLSATDRGRMLHGRATRVLGEWPALGSTLYTSGQVLREFLSAATRPVSSNGLGQSSPTAAANIAALRRRLELLAEGDQTLTRLIALLATTSCSGKQVQDAHIVATMLCHGVTTIVTANVSDFTRFGDLIQVIDLADVATTT